MFNREWEYEFFFCENAAGGAECLICSRSIFAKRDNIKQHYLKKHRDCISLSDDDRMIKLFELKLARMKKLPSSNQEPPPSETSTSSQAKLKASYIVSLELARKGRPLGDGTFFKEVAVSVLQCFGEEGHKMSKKVEEISLSRQTVTRRIQDTAAFLYSKAMYCILNSKCISLALDESIDLSDTSQLIICFRAVDENFNVTEDMLNLYPLHKRARGIELFNALNEKVFSYVDQNKLASICTDGAPVMVGTGTGLIGQLRSHGISTQSFHCIIHQENLFAKASGCEETMKTLISIIKQIRGGHRALTHRTFREFLEELDAEFSDILLFTEVRWLSKGKCIERLFSLKTEVALFLENEATAEAKELSLLLSNPSFLIKFAFLCDITSFFSKLNLNMQGKYKFIFDLVSAVSNFKRRIIMLEQQFKNGDFKNFPKTAEVIFMYDIKEQLLDFYKDFDNIKLNFENHFKDFDAIKHLIDLHNSPLTCSVDDFDDETKLELQSLQSDASLPLDSGLEFWRQIGENKYPLLKSKIFQLYSMFGSTYICESSFSTMAFIKNKQRTMLTDNHLEDLMRIKLHSSDINVDELMAFTKNKD